MHCFCDDHSRPVVNDGIDPSSCIAVPDGNRVCAQRRDHLEESPPLVNNSLGRANERHILNFPGRSLECEHDRAPWQIGGRELDRRGPLYRFLVDQLDLIALVDVLGGECGTSEDKTLHHRPVQLKSKGSLERVLSVGLCHDERVLLEELDGLMAQHLALIPDDRSDPAPGVVGPVVRRGILGSRLGFGLVQLDVQGLEQLLRLSKSLFLLRVLLFQLADLLLSNFEFGLLL
mmetsp:Transcript_9653/g.21969  ORF Transcript_9653/g.21969 Transcript_9653/m.21969 type:complete len:232 (-) Transcript_9653:2935-3630(-)